MNSKLIKDWPLWIIILLPFAYLAYLYPQLPETVPLHWNAQGEIDRYGPKKELWILPFVLPVLVYVIFLIVPRIDPKKKLQHMELKLDQLKFWLTLIMSLLTMVIIHMASSRESANLTLVFGVVGLLFAILGNYFKTIKPNYFIGIRTPWTLEDDRVWKDTHKMAGTYWFIGGLIMVLCSFLFSPQVNLYVTLGITAILVLIPTYYSYRRFRQLTNK